MVYTNPFIPSSPSLNNSTLPFHIHHRSYFFTKRSCCRCSRKARLPCRNAHETTSPCRHDGNESCQHPSSSFVPLRRRRDPLRWWHGRGIMPGSWVRDTGPARRIRQRYANIPNHCRLKDFQGRHLLTHAITTVPSPIQKPFQPTRHAPRTAGALRCCCVGGGFQERDGFVVDERRHLCGLAHPAREVGFEGVFVRVAFVVLFTYVFHDAVGKEGKCDGVDESLSSGAPYWVSVCLWEYCQLGSIFNILEGLT